MLAGLPQLVVLQLQDLHDGDQLPDLEPEVIAFFAQRLNLCLELFVLLIISGDDGSVPVCDGPIDVSAGRRSGLLPASPVAPRRPGHPGARLVGAPVSAPTAPGGIRASSPCRCRPVVLGEPGVRLGVCRLYIGARQLRPGRPPGQPAPRGP